MLRPLHACYLTFIFQKETRITTEKLVAWSCWHRKYKRGPLQTRPDKKNRMPALQLWRRKMHKEDEHFYYKLCKVSAMPIRYATTISGIKMCKSMYCSCATVVNLAHLHFNLSWMREWHLSWQTPKAHYSRTPVQKSDWIEVNAAILPRKDFICLQNKICKYIHTLSPGALCNRTLEPAMHVLSLVVKSDLSKFVHKRALVHDVVWVHNIFQEKTK